MTLNQDTIDAVFTATATTTWTDTNLGPMAHVTVNGKEYTSTSTVPAST
ncbi:hypothetical protein ACFQ3Z_16375 [Streptomyces nogalater]